MLIALNVKAILLIHILEAGVYALIHVQVGLMEIQLLKLVLLATHIALHVMEINQQNAILVIVRTDTPMHLLTLVFT